MNPMTAVPVNEVMALPNAFAINAGKHLQHCWVIVLCLLLQFAVTAQAELLGTTEADEESVAQQLLLELTPLLHDAGIDVLFNLNDRDLARSRLQRKRLGQLADLRQTTYPSYPLSEELHAIEQAFHAGQVAGVALLPHLEPAEIASEEFLRDWLNASDAERIFVSASSADFIELMAIADAAETLAWRALFLGSTAGDEPGSERVGQGSEQNDIPATLSEDSLIGRFYATSPIRFSLDSAAARDYAGGLSDLAWLGERVRRNSDSIFRENDARGERSLARTEPAVFRKETLGDEFSESTIREIVVPGGVALGETAGLAISVERLQFDQGQSQLQVVDVDGEIWQLPAIDSASLKSLFDFASRSLTLGTDAIVDIDAESRVKLSAALRDTESGYQLVHADTVPFNYVDYLPVTKSVIIDTLVSWFPDSRGNSASSNSQSPDLNSDLNPDLNPDLNSNLTYATEYEVRFLSADNMRLAQTRVALAYEYEQATGVTAHVRNWGRDATRLRENLDYPGLGKEMEVVAESAAWIGFWRRVLEDDVRFVDGRYEFMKINKYN